MEYTSSTRNLIIAEPNKSNGSRKLLAIAGIVISFLSLTVVFMIFLMASQNSGRDEIVKQEICTTKSCIRAANRIIENGNFSVDPCEDFYEFACGGFMAKTRIGEAKRIGTFDILDKEVALALSDILTAPIGSSELEAFKKVKTLFKSCMDETFIQQRGDKALLEFIKKELGGWPLLHPTDYRPDLDNTYNLMALLYKNGVRPLLLNYVFTSPSDPKKSVIHLRQSEWFWPKSYYQANMTWYKNMIIGTLRLFNSTNANLEQDVDKMVNFERKLGLKLLDKGEIRKSRKKEITLGELKRNYSRFDWDKYLVNGLFKSMANIQIFETEPIVIGEESFINAAIDLIATEIATDKRNVENLLVWALVKDSFKFLPDIYKESSRDYVEEIELFGHRNKRHGTTIPRAAWGRFNDKRAMLCVEYVGETMDFAVGRLYVDRYFSKSAKKAALEMIINLRNEFKRMLNEYDWIDAESRKSVSEKIDSLYVKIGYHDAILDDSYLNRVYEKLKFSSNNFFQNNIQIEQLAAVDNLLELRSPVDATKWFMPASEVNAYYSSPTNEICFPAGILQPPFYDSQTPNYLNYGGIGSVIGHEITHGFDDQGRQYDKSGVYYPDGLGLWSNSTIENYKSKAQCIIDQYNKFEIKGTNKTANGYQTQGENIADNGGLKQAFRAYKKWASRNGKEQLLPGLDFTQEQLFFINYGQIWCNKYSKKYLETSVSYNVHSLGQFRVLGPTSNYEEFSRVFGCGSCKKKRCSVW